MYWKMAVSAWRRVSHVRRQISSALIVLKKVSTAAEVGAPHRRERLPSAVAAGGAVE